MVNIPEVNDEGLFFSDEEHFGKPLAEGNEGALHLGLPKDIYTLINHYTDAKDIWDNVKMLLEGSELTKEDRESQLYDDFEYFCQNKRETIHDYYARFTKLINDIRNIKMTMPRIQLNSKFVNNMLPEWGRFVTAVKLNRGLKESNYDQLYAYLKQHEAHANENKMMLERFTQHTIDPLALMSNVSPRQYSSQSSTAPPSTHGRQNRGRIARNCTQPKQPQNSEYFKDKMLLMQAQENRVALDEEHLLFIVCGQDNVVDEDVDEQSVHDLALNVDNVFQADDLDHVYDEASPSYDSDILSRVPDCDNYLDAICEHHEYVKGNAVSVVQSNVSSIPNDAYVMIINEMHEQASQSVSANEQNKKENKYLEEFLDMKALKEKVEDKLYKQDQSLQTIHMLCKPRPYYDEQKKVAIGYKNHLCLSHAKQVQPALYNGHEIIKTNHVPAVVYNSEDTLEIAEITMKKMNDKMKTPLWTEQNINIRSLDYSKENYLATFTQQTQLTPGIQKALTKEIKEMKEIFKESEAEVDQNVVNRKYDEIEQKNLLIVNDNLIVDCLSKEVFYIATNSELTVSRFTEMHDFPHYVQARCLELEAELSKLNYKIQKDDHNELVKRFSNLETTALLTENENLKAQIHENIKCITMDSVKPRFLAPGRYAIDVEPIPPRSRNNREVHLDYLKHLKESVETLREIVDEAKVESPLDRSLASACLYTKHSQELLEYVIGTCPKDFNKRDNKHASTPLTRKKQVTFEDQCETSNNNTHKHVEKLNNQKTNVPVNPFTGINNCTDARGSNPRSNTKKNRISSAKRVNKNKVEEHHRTNKSSLKITNYVDSSISYKRTVINSNSHFVWKTCNKCIISANHDMCMVNYLHSMNASPSVENVVLKVKKV
ncbi:hypothetical protein Tco_0123864 [Tanacetum coccineum]